MSRRHGELGQAVASYKQDLEHGTWELRFPAGVHGIRRAEVINSDVVRSAEFVELRRISGDLKAPEVSGPRGTRRSPIASRRRNRSPVLRMSAIGLLR